MQWWRWTAAEHTHEGRAEERCQQRQRIEEGHSGSLDVGECRRSQKYLKAEGTPEAALRHREGAAAGVARRLRQGDKELWMHFYDGDAEWNKVTA